MKGVHRTYYHAAVKKGAKPQLKDALSMLENRCLPPRQAPPGTDDLHRKMLGMTFWPSRHDLVALDLSVKKLALLYRAKVPNPLWKAFELVNRQWQGFHLIRRLDGLVSRAHKLLEEGGDSALTWVRREVRGSGERALEAKSFLADLQRIQREPKTAAKIKWPRYEHFLFRPGDNKRVQLCCGDSPASPPVICYARALEMIVDDKHHDALRDDASPLLEWVARVGNPEYSDVLRWNDFMKWRAEREAQCAVEERVQSKRAQDRERQRRHRKAKISC